MNGGEIARKGFIYQDWATAFYFITNEDVDQVNIELHDDFSIFRLDKDPTVRRFFQAKSSDQGSLSWTKFRTSILPNFYTICEEFHHEQENLIFEIVANQKPSSQLKQFIESLQKLRDERISEDTFRTRNDRLVDALESTIENKNDIGEINIDVFNQLLGGIHFRFHGIGELVSEVERFIESCQGGRKKYARNTVLEAIRDTSSGTISKRSLERDIGYRLETVQQSTSNYAGSPDKIRSEAQDVYSNYADEDVNVTQPAKDKRKATNYFDLVGTQTSSDGEEIELEVSESNIREGFEKAEQAKRDYQAAIQDVTRGFENLFNLDDGMGDDE